MCELFGARTPGARVAALLLTEAALALVQPLPRVLDDEPESEFADPDED